MVSCRYSVYGFRCVISIRVFRASYLPQAASRSRQILASHVTFPLYRSRLFGQTFAAPVYPTHLPCHFSVVVSCCLYRLGSFTHLSCGVTTITNLVIVSHNQYYLYYYIIWLYYVFLYPVNTLGSS